MTSLTNIPRARVEFGPDATQTDEADMQVDLSDAVDMLVRSLMARGCGEAFARLCAEYETPMETLK